MINKKEARGIYNVSFNEKKATVIDVEVGIFEDIVIKQLIYYVKGYHNPLRNKGLGSEHIKLHLDENSIGAINIQELISLSTKIREYLNEFKEAFLDEKEAKIYEWQDKKGTRFRVVIDKISKRYLENLEKKYQERGLQLPLTSLDEIIITFYSDRNLNERMLFKNPKVKAYYESLEQAIQGDKAMDKLRKEYKERDVRKQSQNKDYLKNKITKKVRI